MKKYILSSDYKLSVVAVVDGQKSEESETADFFCWSCSC